MSKLARGESWCHAEQYPTTGFESQAVRAATNGYVATGQLTLRGGTKSVEIPFTAANENGRRYLLGNFTVDRQEYGIEGPFLFGSAVGDDVEVSLRIPVEK